MRAHTFLRFAASTFAVYAALHANANAALIVSGDEWTLTNAAYGVQDASVTRLVDNMAGLFGGTNYLIVSNGSAGVTDLSSLSRLQSQLAGLGKTVSTSTTYNALLLAGKDAVLLLGLGQGANDTANLAAYVNGGGNLVVALGTGIFGTAAGEAAAWNPLLNQFGLSAGNVWMTAPGLLDFPVIQGNSALDAGVQKVVWGYGQTISELNPADPATSLLVAGYGGGYGNQGAFGVFMPTAAVPEPGSYALLLAGVAGIGMVRRRRRAL